MVKCLIIFALGFRRAVDLLFLILAVVIFILFRLHEEPQIGLLFAVDFLPDFVCEVDVLVGVRASDLARFEVGLVNTFLAVLEIEAHVIVLEFRVVLLDDFLAVLDLSKSAQSAGIEEFKLGVVEQVNARKGLHRKVQNANSKQLPVYSMKHVVSTLEFGVDIFIFVFAIFALVWLIHIFGRNYPVGADFLLIFIHFSLLFRSIFRYLGITRIKERDLAEEALIAIPIFFVLFFVDAHLVKVVQVKRLLRKHGPPYFDRIFIFCLYVFTRFFVPERLIRYLLFKILLELFFSPNRILIVFDSLFLFARLFICLFIHQFLGHIDYSDVARIL